MCKELQVCTATGEKGKGDAGRVHRQGKHMEKEVLSSRDEIALRMC